MFGSLFDYAGPTALACAACVCAGAVLIALGAGLVVGLRRRKIARLAVPALVLALYAGVWLWTGPLLDHGWLYLQENASRRYATYVALTAATAVVPPLGETGRQAFVHIATRDTGFAKGRPVSVTRENGHETARYEDEDYPGGVTTFDQRPVETGFRFRATRRLPALIALTGLPTAKTVRVLGCETAFHAPLFQQAGLTVLTEEDARPADLVFVAPSPDWLVDSDTPTAAQWRRYAAGLSRGGAAALRLDGRLLSRARAKGILDDFKAVFGGYRLWCVGRKDFVVTSGGGVLFDEVLDLFAKPDAFAAFSSADIYAPADLFACYMGTDAEIEPALGTVSFSHARAVWHAPRLAFVNVWTNHLAEVRAPALTPYYIPPRPWLQRGLTDTALWQSLSNRIEAVQSARRDILLGFDAADRGQATNALEKWSAAATVNPRDPLLANLADSLDLEGRRFLRIGNINGALRCYENRLMIRPTDVTAVHNFGVCLKKAGHWAVAARVFAKAVTMDPKTDEHRYELVETCAASGHEDVATRQMDVLMKRHPDDPALKLRAARLLVSRTNKVRDETRAVELAEEAVRMTGWKDRAYVAGLADVYVAAGRAVMGLGLKKKMKEMRFEK